MKLTFPSLLLAVIFSITRLHALELYSCQATLSHTEGKGIGYPKGYTTIGFFLMPSCEEYPSLYPFIDVRGHGFDNLKLAANVGIGLRYLTESLWVYGANVYYDNRQGSHHALDQVGCASQQIGVGVEALGPCWDFRMNFYQPVGTKVNNFTQTTFNDNLGITPIITRKQQSTMKGTDVEVGTCVGKWNICNDYDWSLYAAAGSYYLAPETAKKRWGGKGRLSATIARYFFCEVKGYYDEVARGLAQVCVGINFPLYPFASEKSRACHFPCRYSCCWPTFREMISQPVVRAEIIPLHSHTFH